MLEDILLQVYKPARYIGQEWNLPKKDFHRAEIKFALCFPDLYEIGMSNLGVRIIFDLLNGLPNVVCERVFSVGCDLEGILRSQHLEIFSLESRRPLKDFDLIGFSLSYELSYTNVLNILSGGGIPLKASLRNESYPLVIAGGPCTVNPEPMHEFFDLFVIGEAEEVILEIIDTYAKFKEKYKNRRLSKQDLLVIFSSIEGVYVPSFYETRYSPEGKIIDFKNKIDGVPLKIKKRFIKDLDNAPFPLNWLIPHIAIIHDRVTLEIMRGCPNHCRFCQARYQYFPFRQRNIQKVLDLASGLYKRTGYEELSLCGLSVGDYSYIEELSQRLIALFKGKGIGLSLPSLKPKAAIGNLSCLIASVKKTGLTFAPEAATEKLRKILGKDFDTEGFFKALAEAYSCGYRHIKLYFMIGLPCEEKEDLDSIIAFSTRVSELRMDSKSGPAEVNISINTLIPKPHTPMQWFKMEDLEKVADKQNYLKSKIKNGRLKLNFHNRKMNFLEGILSRGDRRLSEVILRAFQKGARFDAWENYFNFDLWQEAFRELKLDPAQYLGKRQRDELLPWDFLDLGVGKETLRDEADKISC